MKARNKVYRQFSNPPTFHRAMVIAFSVIVVLACTIPVSVRAKNSVQIGICRSGLAAAGENERERTLADVQSIGATWVRDTPRGGSPKDIDDFLDVLRRAKEHNLKVLVNITQIDSDYDGPLPPNGCGWNQKKFSTINLKKFDARIHALFNAAKAQHLVIEAVEFGNEDDQYCYDADIPNGHHPSHDEMIAAARAYGEFLKLGATVLHEPGYYPAAKVITFGMAHIHNPKIDHLDNPAHFIALLRNINGFNYLDNPQYHVDGYGTHIYVSPNDIRGDIMRTINQDVAELGKDKPYWITEWGFTHNQFPNKKGQNLGPAMAEFVDVLDDTSREIPLGPAFFYSYNEWLVDRGGKMLPAARGLSRK